MTSLMDLPRVVGATRPPARARQAHRVRRVRLTPALSQLGSIGIALGAYLVVRFLTQGDRDRALAHGADLLRVERALGIDWERAVQQAVIANGALRGFFTLLYAWGYWPMVVGTLLFLWRRDRTLFTVFRNALFASGAFGLLVFATYPAAPPRMLQGFTDTVAASGQHFVAHPSGFTNPYAALPSFHAGWFFIAAIVLARATTRPARRLALRSLAPLMSVAVVVTANHYLIDVLLGVGLSLGALALFERRRNRVASVDQGARVSATERRAASAAASSGNCWDARSASTRAA